MTAPRLAALMLAAAAIGTRKGRCLLGSAMISMGAELLPDAPHDDERDARIRDQVMAEVRRSGMYRRGGPI